MSSPFVGQIPMMSENLIRLYHEARPAEITSGLQWYPTAHNIVIEWADTYQLSIATVASVIAAISPQVSWSRNLIIAKDILAGDPPSIGGAIGANVEKAKRIREDHATNIVDYFPTGPKVASFAANLMGDWNVVTVDTHASQAALLNPLATPRLTIPAYAAFATAYQQAAKSLGMLPAHLQAIIWVHWKYRHPTDVKRLSRRKWA